MKKDNNKASRKRAWLLRVMIAYIFGMCGFVAYALLLYPDTFTGAGVHPLLAVIHLMTTPYVWWGVMIAVAIMALFLIAGWSANLDYIKSRRVGDGQYGDARFLADNEITEVYDTIDLRADKSGWILSLVKKTDKFVLDTDDVNVAVLAPPGSGKTRRLVIPNIFHSMVSGDFIVATDTKGTLVKFVAPFARLLGYKVINLDAGNPLHAHRYNFLDIISFCIDKANYSDDNITQIEYRAKAQRYAKILAKQIINIIQKNTSAGANEFFYKASEGIITTIILLIAQYADDDERHIVSVLKVMLELMETDNDEEELKKTRLYYIIGLLDEKDKTAWYAAAGAKADAKVALSVFATGIASFLDFIDDELEQMIVGISSFHIEELLTDHKVCVIVTIPEENKPRHFMYSLLINNFTNELLDISRSQPTGVLPFTTRVYLDEFGTAPSIDNVESILTAARERKIYIMLIVQSLAQLYEKYGQHRAEIIIGACKTFIFSGLGALQDKDAERLSKALGKYTLQSGSISKSNNKLGDRGNVTTQMIAKELMSVQDIQLLVQGEFIAMRTGRLPLKLLLADFTDYELADVEREAFMVDLPFAEVNYFSADELQRRIEILRTQKTELMTEEEPEEELMAELGEVQRIFDAYSIVDGIVSLMERDYRAVVKQLYGLHKRDILDTDTFSRYKDFFKKII
jgi:type IV secretion system protein VirD4